ncbi:MAG: hypothetical protein QNJ40_06515 [Xanthomonadales bacterium]|nr:hypothetical protein [Xanthomonadales bacterium]
MQKLRPILLICLSLLLTACDSRSQSAGQDVMPVIVTYEVPDGNAARVSDVLSGLLNDSGGSARALSSDVVVVSAFPAVQAGVQQVIDQLEKSSESEARRVRMHYWLVNATPADSVYVADNLDAVREALDDAARSAGPMSFTRVDYVQQTLRSGTRGIVGGANLNGETEVAVLGDRVALDVELTAPRGGHVRASVDLTDDETVLLAQISNREQESDLLLFVIRAEVF